MSKTQIITHNLNTDNPSVSLIDKNGSSINNTPGDISYSYIVNDLNNITITIYNYETLKQYNKTPITISVKSSKPVVNYNSNLIRNYVVTGSSTGTIVPDVNNISGLVGFYDVKNDVTYRMFPPTHYGVTGPTGVKIIYGTGTSIKLPIISYGTGVGQYFGFDINSDNININNSKNVGDIKVLEIGINRNDITFGEDSIVLHSLINTIYLPTDVTLQIYHKLYATYDLLKGDNYDGSGIIILDEESLDENGDYWCWSNDDGIEFIRWGNNKGMLLPSGTNI